MEAERRPGDNDAAGRWGDALRWGHHLLSGIITAHIHWAPDDTPNSALSRYIRMLDTFGHRFRKTVPLIGPYLALSQGLCTPECLPCDPRKFDRFAKCLTTTTSKHRATTDRAELAMYHPTQADPHAMLELIQSWYQGHEIPTHPMKKVNGRNSLGYRMLRACFLLKIKNCKDDAAWFEEMVQHHHPVVWYNRDAAIKRFASDPKLRHLLQGTSIPQS